MNVSHFSSIDAFNAPTKSANSVNTERQALEAIANFLDGVPNVHVEEIDSDDMPSIRGVGNDFLIHSRFGDKPLLFAVEVKASGQPRNVRDAAFQLQRYRRDGRSDAISIVMAPYLPSQARDVCREEEVGYLDFLGNTFIAFDTIYIERDVAGRPEPEKRALRSLYKPKSARVLRALLADPGRAWRTIKIAETVKVSVGLVSQISIKLREQGWAVQRDDGLVLTDPDALLDDWAEHYAPPRGEEHRCYTPYHGDELADRLRSLVTAKGGFALASYLAAEWLAPYARDPNTYLYADEPGFADVKAALDLRPAPPGANIVIVIPENDVVLRDAQPVTEGLLATSLVQTYLDLIHAGDRGAEGAEHLRRERLA